MKHKHNAVTVVANHIRNNGTKWIIGHRTIYDLYPVMLIEWNHDDEKCLTIIDQCVVPVNIGPGQNQVDLEIDEIAAYFELTGMINDLDLA